MASSADSQRFRMARVRRSGVGKWADGLAYWGLMRGLLETEGSQDEPSPLTFVRFLRGITPHGSRALRGIFIGVEKMQPVQYTQ